jgi:hypothetical protein
MSCDSEGPFDGLSIAMLAISVCPRAAHLYGACLGCPQATRGELRASANMVKAERVGALHDRHAHLPLVRRPGPLPPPGGSSRLSGPRIACCRRTVTGGDRGKRSMPQRHGRRPIVNLPDMPSSGGRDHAASTQRMRATGARCRELEPRASRARARRSRRAHLPRLGKPRTSSELTPPAFQAGLGGAALRPDRCVPVARTR